MPTNGTTTTTSVSNTADRLTEPTVSGACDHLSHAFLAQETDDKGHREQITLSGLSGEWRALVHKQIDIKDAIKVEGA